MNERIALIRKDQRLKQDAFANDLGLTKNFISLLETGKREPSDRTIKDICRVYNVNEMWLRTGEGERYLPSDRDSLLADFSLKLLEHSDEDFVKKFVGALSKLDVEQWELIANMADALTKKEE